MPQNQVGAVSSNLICCAAWQDAEVFRRAKGASEPQCKTASAVAAGAKRTRGVAFGSGAADEDDSYGMMEDYAVDNSDKRKGLLFEIADGSDEDDMPVVMGRLGGPSPTVQCSFVPFTCLKSYALQPFSSYSVL